MLSSNNLSFINRSALTQKLILKMHKHVNFILFFNSAFYLRLLVCLLLPLVGVLTDLPAALLGVLRPAGSGVASDFLAPLDARLEDLPD